MKKIILTILVFCFAVFSISAQVQSNKTQKGTHENISGQSKTAVPAKKN